METFITSDELFSRIRNILHATAGREKDDVPGFVNKQLHEILVMACHEGVRNSQQAFGNLFAQVDYLCRKFQFTPADRMAIQTMRRHSNHTDSLKKEDLLYDLRALCLLVSAIFATFIPGSIASLIPLHLPPPSPLHHPSPMLYPYLRGIVEQWDDHTMTVTIDDEGRAQHILVDYSAEHLQHLHGLLHEGMQLNLLNLMTDQTGTGKGSVPQLVVVEPDFLIDISSIARCFESYGHHPLNYTMNRMAGNVNTQATLLGNFAGSALDDIVNGHTSVNGTIRNHFKEKAISYCTCAGFNPQQFVQDARQQAGNIRQAVEILTQQHPSDFLLEPTFLCEHLGLQGRVDLMTTDFRLLVEQKSGKNYHIESHRPNEHGSMTPEQHYVQLLLYFGVLRQNFSLGLDMIDMRLLYSKYPAAEGLIAVNYYRGLFHEAIALRNQIVAHELHVAQYGFDSLIDTLVPDTVVTQPAHATFFNKWKRPQLQELCGPLQRLSPLESSYYCTMMTFVYREQRINRLGAQEGTTSCSSDLWNMPLHEKIETGNIYTALTITKKEMSTGYNGYDLITLHVPDQGDDFLPNFRTGDMVFLYAYREEPDVRHHILYKGVLKSIRTDELVVALTDGQQNPNAFNGTHYAIEHAPTDTTPAAIRSLHTFITAPDRIRQLLLAQRNPKGDDTRTLSRSYHPDYDEVVLRAKQADDYYLLVGPPGTGKTSMALRFLVEEMAMGQPILIMSYTNRAVDEICAMLTEAGRDFIRIGSEYRCDARYHHHLVGDIVEQQPQLEALKQRIATTPVIVGTTNTLMSHQGIFQLCRFSLAIVDEASQILEPDLIGLLVQVPKFILIGDHKQLPAVVQQPESDSRTDDPLLHDICLTDCRNSLFERLLNIERRSGRTSYIGILRKQGRMHPDIADFTNRMFYPNEHLQPVPLPHQEEESGGRLRFIPSAFNIQTGHSDKVNLDEARIVAQEIRRIHEQYGDRFEAHRTVGIIVPYRNQIAVIRHEIEKLYAPDRPPSSLTEITIDTVERYQGSQRDIIIYSFTVQHRYQLEFLTASCFVETDADGTRRTIDRKLNVALTRARKQLILTGNEQILSANPLFRQLLAYIRTQEEEKRDSE